MRKVVLLLLFIVSICMATAYGRNKVQSGEQDWWEIRARHFTIYFPQGGEVPAETLLVHTERVLLELSERFNYLPENKIPIILYLSPGDFRQTNINPYEIPQGVGGFTEFFKGRVVIPFNGFWSEFRHVIAHELNHAFIFDMIYRRSLREIIMARTPLWLMEGLAEFTSSGWDGATEAEFRDMVINNQIVSIEELSKRTDYIVYRQGQAIYHFMFERYGEEVFLDFVFNIRNSEGLEGAVFAAMGMSLAQFNERFQEWARETYLSELACCESPDDIGNPIRRNGDRIVQNGSVVSSDGGLIAGVEWHHADLAVAVRSTLTGELESRPFVSGGYSDVRVSPMYRVCSFSPTADSIAIAVQYISGDRIIVCFDEEQVQLPFEMDLIRDPVWSPCGAFIAFAGMYDGELDIYVWNLSEHSLSQISHDYVGERDLSWNGDEILCAAEVDPETTMIHGHSLDGSQRTIFIDSSEIRYPISVPDGILFMSDMNGYPDLYLLHESSGEVDRLTALYRTIDSPSWANSNEILTFVSSDWNGNGVFLAYDILERRVIFSEPGSIAVSYGITENTDTSEDVSIHIEEAGNSESVTTPDSSEREETRVEVISIGIEDQLEIPDVSVEPAEGEFECSITPYSPRISVDYASALAAYDSYLGLAGYTQVILSDILAHHQIIINMNMNGGSLSEIDAAVYYGYLKHRMDLGFGLFRESNRYLFRFSDGREEGVRDVDFGGFGAASYPFSPSVRIDCSLSYRRLSRTGIWNSSVNLDEDIVSINAGAVVDNSLWGSVGPRIGKRFSVRGEFAPGISGSASYCTVFFDFRNYTWVSGKVTLATRFAGGTSWGSDAQTFFLGGAMPHRLLWGEVDTINELLGFYTNYGDILRGYDYVSIQGRRYGLFSTELRVPFINTLALDAPLPITFRNGRGVLFIDLGCAFNDISSFHGASTAGGYHLEDLKMGIGIGYRINLGYFVLKHDIAWRTDLRGISRKPENHITLGAEF
ncbi:MAG: hypothetical protein K8R76_06555 [Candidatus Aegiribacteria sp.]|nr:hypothetical protein [Candidatus Aegiribacteria sp.]